MLEARLAWLWARRRPLVMGILNVTPDSFSDGGRLASPEEAVSHGLRLLDEEADIVDIGGESTRPGALPVSCEQECGRVVPVIAALHAHRPEALLSVDTSKPEVASRALQAGATIINDITAGSDPAMLLLAATQSAVLILMHRRGTPETMQADTHYADVVAEVTEYLGDRARAAAAAGVPPQRLWLDPGIGFGKDVEGNLSLLAQLPGLAALGHPVVVGVSRKSFIGRLTGAEVGDRLPGSLAALTPLAALPRVVARVHDVAATVQFLTVLAAVARAA